MGFSIRLLKIKCLEESDETSNADEPFVLVTAIDLGWPPPLTVPPTTGIPSPITFCYGEWKNFDKDEELTLIGEQPFWVDSPLGEITDPAAVCFVVTVMEHDHGDLDAYRGTVEAAATASLTLSAGSPRPNRVSRLLNATRSAIGLLNLPSLDDHVGTKELRLDNSDLIPLGTTKDKALEIDGGSEGKWELTFRIVHHQRVSFPEGTHLAAITRSADKMEVWAVGTDGLVHGNWFEGRWHGWYSLPGETFNAGTHLAAVTRHADHMEVWGVGPDGTVRGNWFDGNKWRGWYSLPGAKFPAGAPLAAVSRDPDHIEIWGVDVNGDVRGTFADAVQWNPGWYTLAGRKFPAGVHLAAATLSPDHMEVWVVGDDKPIMGIKFDGGWGDWYNLGDEIFAPGTRIAAIRRHFNLAVFAIDLNGHMRDQWFDGTSWRGWYQAGTQVFSPETPVAALTQHAVHMEVLAAGTTSVIQADQFDVTAWQGWFALGSKTFDAQTNLAALSRFEGHMEVWAVQGGVIWGNWFIDSSWQDWYALLWSFEG